MRVSKQVVEARRSRLTELLLERGYLPISQLCQELGVSEATARRDLAALESNDQIRRTYGGALADFNANFVSFRERLKLFTDSKKGIAREAAGLIMPGMRVYLDAGTTMFALARELRQRALTNLTIITNNLALLETLGSVPGARIIVIGGELFERQSVLFGEEAVRAVESHQIDMAFFSAQSMNPDGLWNSQRDIVRFQKAIIKAAKRICFCLDHSKLGRTAPELLVPWSKVPMIVSDLTLQEFHGADIPISALRLLSTKK